MSRPTPGLDDPRRRPHRTGVAGARPGRGSLAVAVPDRAEAPRRPRGGGRAAEPRDPWSSPGTRLGSARGGTGRVLAGVAAGLALLAIVGGRLGEPTSTASSPNDEVAVVAPSEPGEVGPVGESSSAPGDDLVPQRGAGTLRAVPVPGEDSTRSGRPVRYSVEIEDGLRVDEAEYARTVRQVLTDGRGWETRDGVHFVHVDPVQAGDGAAVEVHITLASPDTVDRLCAPLVTQGEVSCQNGNRVVLNALRWTRGVSSYEGQLPRYREYLVNHEVGHALGHGHEACPGPDQPAPVMLQQTLGLDGCTRYPWPVPDQPS